MIEIPRLTLILAQMRRIKRFSNNVLSLYVSKVEH